MSEQFAAVASSLLISDRVASHTSLIGEDTAELRTAIGVFVDSLPANVRKPFTGSCTESALVSDQLWALDSARNDGCTTTLGEATPHFSESAIISKMIRGRGHPVTKLTSMPIEPASSGWTDFRTLTSAA